MNMYKNYIYVYVYIYIYIYIYIVFLDKCSKCTPLYNYEPSY